MNNLIFMNQFPENIRKEIEHLQKLVLPLARKTSKYMFWTYPLIGISLLNLVYLLFFSPQEMETNILLFVYALIGAIGWALYKEIKLNKKEIEKIGVNYIIERVKKSNFLSDERKSFYIKKVKEVPIEAMENFIRFLQEEDRLRQSYSEEEE